VPNWDGDSPRLRENLTRLLNEMVLAAERRETPAVEVARRWQTLTLGGWLRNWMRCFPSARNPILTNSLR